ncbi:MAG: hypothetical protein ACR2FM_05155 [Candidatus Saccharimonadales bacterium]
MEQLNQHRQPSSTIVRHALGAMGTALALVGASPAIATAAANHEQNSNTPETQGYELPKKPSSLRGYERPLNPEARQSLTDSTLKIAKRYKGSDRWEQHCTGVKVTTGADNYVSTAAHCFKEFTGADTEGLLDGPSDQPKAFNIISRTADFYDFAVFDPRLPKGLRQPLAIIDGISISNRTQDRALLSVHPTEVSANTANFRSFDQITAQPLALEQKKAVARPAPGQKVALFGVPVANGDRQLAGIGRYVGRLRFQHKNGGTEYADVVGIKPKRIDQDTCNYGASGSSYSATAGNATYVSGPLSKRLNSIWDPPDIDNKTDFSEQRGDVTNEISNNERWRAIYQQRLNVDLSSFSTICTYSVALPGTSRDLVDGLLVSPPEVQFPGKGGDDSGSMK